SARATTHRREDTAAMVLTAPPPPSNASAAQSPFLMSVPRAAKSPKYVPPSHPASLEPAVYRSPGPAISPSTARCSVSYCDNTVVSSSTSSLFVVGSGPAVIRDLRCPCHRRGWAGFAPCPSPRRDRQSTRLHS